MAEQDQQQPTKFRRRSRWSVEWSLVFLVAGLTSGASWTDALLYGIGGGILSAFVLFQMGPATLFWGVLTLRRYHLWKSPDWTDPD